jgi:hypothetical protein
MFGANRNRRRLVGDTLQGPDVAAAREQFVDASRRGRDSESLGGVRHVHDSRRVRIPKWSMPPSWGVVKVSPLTEPDATSPVIDVRSFSLRALRRESR